LTACYGFNKIYISERYAISVPVMKKKRVVRRKRAVRKSVVKQDFTILVLIGVILLAFLIASYSGAFNKTTGKAVAGGGGEHTIGPSSEEQDCMRACAVSVGCTPMDMNCMRDYSAKCMAQCNAVKPEITEETSCMEGCVLVGCGEFDFTCHAGNKDRCEKECNMIKEPEAKSEEEKCIRECVNKVQPGLICRGGEGGEKGDEVCQRCAKECEHLYAGPCLDEEKLEAKKAGCQTCEKCYGEPLMGDSGEGYQCIVDVVCNDASSLFGDEPGTGPGIGESSGESGGGIFQAIGNFFSGLFGG